MLSKTSDWINNTPIEYRKKLGQYFTPDSIKEVLFKYLPKNENSLILEPSVGTGEFISFIKAHFINPTIKAYDIDTNILKLNNDIDCECKDFLELQAEPIYDFVIGNPPYFQFSPEKNVINKFKNIISGRINIYGLFIKHSIDFLKEGGYLAFVVPTSMNNGKYFEKLREYIVSTCEVEQVILFNDGHFIDAQQNVQILILKKGINTGKNLFKWKGLTFFTPDYLKLYEISKGKMTLKEAGYEVKTGTITWNQHKEKLTDDNSKTKLIWSNNLKESKIVEFTHDIKKQYIDINKSDRYPAILVNRITGIGSNLNLKGAMINEPYLAENHINVIKPLVNIKISIEEVFNKINLDESKILLRSLMGNTQVSKTELENLIIF